MSLEHDFVQQSLADKDINSSVKDGKIVVHKDNSAAAKSHLKKIGYGHVQVVTEHVFSFIDYLKENSEDETPEDVLENYSLEEIELFLESQEYEQLDEISKQTLGSYIRKASLDKGQADYRRGMNKGVSIATLGKHDKDTSSDEATSQKRMKGIYAATRKLSEGVFAPGQIIRSMDSGAKVKIDKVHHDDKMYVGTDVQNGSKNIAIPFHKASYYDENYTD